MRWLSVPHFLHLKMRIKSRIFPTSGLKTASRILEFSKHQFPKAHAEALCRLQKVRPHYFPTCQVPAAWSSSSRGSAVDPVDIYVQTLLALTFLVLLDGPLPSLFSFFSPVNLSWSPLVTNICEIDKCFKSSLRHSREKNKTDWKFKVLVRFSWH